MQNLFIRFLEPEAVGRLVDSFRPGALIYLSTPPRWPGEPRYPTTLKISPGRLESRWFQLVDRHDVVDLRLACHLSRQLRTTALAAHACEDTGEYGWGSYHNGVLAAERFGESEQRPVERVNEELDRRGVPFRIERFGSCAGPGWSTVDLKPGR